MTSPQARGEIGDGGIRGETAILPFQQTDAPGIRVAVVFEAEQVAIGRFDVGSDQDGSARLEDLVMHANTDGLEILLGVDAASRGDRLVEEVVDAAQGEGMVEEVLEQFLDATKGTVADEGEAEHELTKPGLGDGKPEEQLGRVGRRRCEGVVEGGMGLVELLVDELAADLLLGGQFGDG